MFQKIITAVFCTLTAVFLLGGFAIVAGQGIGLILGNGRLVTSVSETLAPYVYGSAGVAGLLAFAMSYAKHSETGDAVDPEAPSIALDKKAPEVDVPPGRASGAV